MSENPNKALGRWKRLRSSSGFRNAMLFLVFLAMSTVFWLMMALNDSAQQNFNVRIQVVNLPDSVTFISDVPAKMHVTVRDKGTNLWRNGFLKNPTLTINFKEYAQDGLLRFTTADMQSSLKTAFGTTAIITSSSLDSLRLYYTTNPGKKVPIVVDAKVYPALGFTLEGSVKASPSNVYVYGEKSVLDTIRMVKTDFVELRDLTETTESQIKLRKIKGARVLPSSVSLTVPIEPLVRKEAMITITPVNVPDDETLLLFPSKVPVEYYVAMSRLGDNDDNAIELTADYNDILNSLSSSKLHVEVKKYPDRLKNLTLKSDSVEYAVVKD